MLDLLLDEGWDLSISPSGDIIPVYSIPQAILVRLKWIEEEWRFNTDIGFPWFSMVLKKNPNIDLITQTIRNTILEVEGVNEAKVDLVKYDVHKRTISFRYMAKTDTEEFVKEVVIGG